MQKDQIIEVWGEFACFTRPELKVERFSYPVITPSAARGIYDAIYCKPAEFRWQITMIELLAGPNTSPLDVMKLRTRARTRTVQRWMAGKEDLVLSLQMVRQGNGYGPEDATANDGFKKCYRLHAYISPWAGFENRITAQAQFKRRASQGKCIYQHILDAGIRHILNW